MFRGESESQRSQKTSCQPWNREAFRQRAVFKTGYAPAVCAALLLFVILVSGCGGGRSSSSSTPPPPTNNTEPLVVDAGPTNSNVNGLFATVTLCVPGTSTCQPIDHVLVDTGSYGLRILSAGGGGELSLSLNQQSNSSGTPIAECVEFADSFTWGPVAMADVEIAGEKASSVPIQVIGDPTYSTVPNTPHCGGSGLRANDNLASLGANGILGVGVFTDDCGPACATSSMNSPYYACPAPTSCAVTTESEANQVQNPVFHFSVDNNGLSIALSPVPDSGSPSVQGTLTFGIGTESNNGLGSATVFPVDGFGNFITEFNGTKYPQSFIDSGSGALFFLDPNTTNLPDCGGKLPGYYCPAAQVTKTATNFGAAGSPSNTVNFNVANAGTLLSSPNNAFNNLAGANPGMVDWGLPFFYGRTVFVAIDGQTTPGGMGPYWAY
jgi:uncharacterized protein DUF3443